MKKIILPIVSLMILAACSNSDKELETGKQLVLTAPAVANTDTAKTVEDVQTPAAAPAPIVNNYYYTTPKPVVVSKPKTVAPKAPVVVAEPAPVEIPEVTNEVPVVTGNNNSTSGTETVATPAPVEVEKKKGMSDAAKGAIIGGVGGAAAGAVIGKNGKGAVIGAVIGAAGGYILGRKADKKSGRIDLIQ